MGRGERRVRKVLEGEMLLGVKGLRVRLGLWGERNEGECERKLSGSLSKWVVMQCPIPIIRVPRKEATRDRDRERI